ncbi:putative GPI anchored protein [Aspergillus heteromorphus CBS 117.55]|uniref:Putative GPI anchored protein n=1 Tax=Aspergillus heteromorphus CBS 117.55 TaxID=1448321 RepID=A0A317WA81_9EURO|nr:putative GPI anchored protein [Aspergillus heteromorphus CBS 117.55]PWY83446.1 putative GPI anchored protein [Aspergillus heteromorphus CBS 117.55]
MKLPILLSLAALAPLAAAHFQLKYPPSQGGSEEQMVNFPCGGGTSSSNRTQVSISAGSFPVALSLGHSQTALEVLLALGTDPGSNYNIVLQKTFEVQGLGAFCLPHVVFNKSILGRDITDGMNATVQVQSDGDPTGGLYACADIQFSSTAQYSEPSSCKNNSGVSAVAFSGAAAQRNANESTADGQAQGSSSSSSSSSASKSSSSSSSSKAPTSTGGAVALETAAWGMLGAAVVGGIAIL